MAYEITSKAVQKTMLEILSCVFLRILFIPDKVFGKEKVFILVEIAYFGEGKPGEDKCANGHKICNRFTMTFQAIYIFKVSFPRL